MGRTSGDYPMASDEVLRGRTLPPGGTTDPGAQSEGGFELLGKESNTDHSKGDPYALPPMLTAGKHGEIGGAPDDLMDPGGQSGKTYEAGVSVPKQSMTASDYPTQGDRDWGTSDPHEGGANV